MDKIMLVKEAVKELGYVSFKDLYALVECNGMQILSMTNWLRHRIVKKGSGLKYIGKRS